MTLPKCSKFLIPNKETEFRAVLVLTTVKRLKLYLKIFTFIYIM